MGPVMLDVQAQELTSIEKEILDHPLVGGVILFSRNYFDPKQLTELVFQIRKCARNDLLIAVDHEGGRVQRFRSEFSAIPAMGSLYDRAASDIARASEYASAFGWLMAAELLVYDIDISFAPVLDINGISDVIGDRSFHNQGEIIIQLASSYIEGMHSAGMKSTGKHFPGHGNVKEDSHVAIPIDNREPELIFNHDMRIFSEIHAKGLLDAVMPAHVIYSQVDDKPAGFSSVWIREHLRNKLNFDGVVFSDDLSMEGAAQIGDYPTRARAALNAGCDMVLACNNPDGAIQILDNLPNDNVASERLASLKANSKVSSEYLSLHPKYKQAQTLLMDFGNT